MTRTPTRPVQVRLPEKADAFLSGYAETTGKTKSDVVVEALDCLRRRQIELQMEAGYRELADDQNAVVTAGLAAGLSSIPD